MSQKKINIILILSFIFNRYSSPTIKISCTEALNILKNSTVHNNVMITSTTETTINKKTTISIQSDYYYNDKYYHSQEINDLYIMTWYGSINNVLYAFYYTKTKLDEETKYSTRLNNSQLSTIKNRQTAIKDNLFIGNTNLKENYAITGVKKSNKYIIQVTNNNHLFSNIKYTFIIKNNIIYKLISCVSIANDSINTSYDYSYNINNIKLPSFDEYPLKSFS